MAKKTKTIDDYRKLAEEYFDECDRANAGCSEKTPLARPYTLSGLLYTLELDRDGFKSLEKTRGGRAFVRSILARIEAFIEENALSGRISATAASNSLKYSFGWNDREKTTDTGSICISLSEDARRLGE